MIDLINYPWIPIAVVLVIIFGWLFITTAIQIRDSKLMPTEHAWEDMRGLFPVGPQLGELPVPITKISFYDQLVYQLNINPLDV